MRRSAWVLAFLLLATTVARGDYLILQYTTIVKKDPEKEKNNPNPITQPTMIAPGVIEDEKTIRYITQTAVEVSKATALPTNQGGIKLNAKTKYGATSIYNDDLLISKLYSGKTVPTAKQKFAKLKATVAQILHAGEGLRTCGIRAESWAG